MDRSGWLGAMLAMLLSAVPAPSVAAQAAGNDDGAARRPSAEAAAKKAESAADSAAPHEAGAAPDGNRFTRQGLTVEFSVRPAGGGGGELRAGEYADVTFRITDAGTGRPVRSLAPGAWMDIGQPVAARPGAPLDCRQKMSLFLAGRVGIRPMVDLGNYFVLALNRDSSISVIDPMVGMAGKTYLYAHIPLSRPGADWAKTEDDRRLFVTVPRAGRVAVVDTENFKVAGGVDVGGVPVRIAIQGDGRYLWVGDDSPDADRSGVAAVDPGKMTVAAHIRTGRGHHEIAVSGDDRYVFVSNRDEGTVSVIDTGRLAKIKDLATGPRPAALSFSRPGQALYVSDAKTGEIAAIDAARLEVAGRIQAEPGVGAIRFTGDGRFALAVNPERNAVHIVDASANRLLHTLPIPGRPHELALTKAFAYVRSLDSEQVAMIPLSELGGERPPAVTAFPAGTAAPASSEAGVAVAGAMVPASGEAAIMVANPSDGNVYFYMEGMVAPMATFRNFGHRPAALTVAGRTFREIEPGVYKSTARLPEAGKYDVGFVLDAPRIVHCFSAEVKENPAVARTGPALAVEYLVADRRVKAKEPFPLKFRLTDAVTGKPRTGLADARVLYYVAPGRGRTVAAAREVGDGIYEASLALSETGAYYVLVAVPSAKVDFGDLAHLSLNAMDNPAQAGRPRAK